MGEGGEQIKPKADLVRLGAAWASLGNYLCELYETDKRLPPLAF